MKIKRLLLLVVLMALTAGVAYLYLSKSRRQTNKIEKASAHVVSVKERLDDYLKSDGLPIFIKNDWRRFQSALMWAEAEARKSGLQLDPNPSAWKRADPEISKLPREVREIFAHPSIIWGRNPKSNQWESVLVLSDKANHRFVLAHISDALGTPKFEVSSVSSDISECLGFGPWHDVPVPSLIESWKAWESEPIAFLRWVGPGQAGLTELRFNPKFGIAREATNLEGDQNIGDFPFLISREVVASAEVLGVLPRAKHPTAKEVWFKSQGQLFITGQEQWDEWSKKDHQPSSIRSNSISPSNAG